MARMQLRSAELTERHQRAEADRASFDKREEVAKEAAKQRTKEERRDRQQMMGEREKNRMRKLKAMEGREWDAEKQEQDYAPRGGGRGGFSRGAHGGVVGSRAVETADVGFGRDREDYTDGREYLYREGRGRGRGEGRGRGGRGGRGGGDARQQRAPQHHDFPELPAGKAAEKKVNEEQAPLVSFPKASAAQEQTPASPGIEEAPPTPLDMSNTGGAKSWADMVESAAT